jgi:hypothetical protein
MLAIDFKINLMRLLKHFLLALFGLFFLSSTSCESDPISHRTLIIDNLITVETQPTYTTNDIVYVNSSFSRFLPEPGYNSLLDIYKTTGSNAYYFEVNIVKKTIYNTWISLPKSSFNVVKGQISSRGEATCVLNPITNHYEFRIGIPLLEAGEYELIITPHIQPDSFYSTINKVVIDIQTTVNTGSIYNFTVN